MEGNKLFETLNIKEKFCLQRLFDKGAQPNSLHNNMRDTDRVNPDSIPAQSSHTIDVYSRIGKTYYTYILLKAVLLKVYFTYLNTFLIIPTRCATPLAVNMSIPLAVIIKCYS